MCYKEKSITKELPGRSTYMEWLGKTLQEVTFTIKHDGRERAPQQRTKNWMFQTDRTAKALSAKPQTRRILTSTRHRKAAGVAGAQWIRGRMGRDEAGGAQEPHYTL